MRPPPPTCWLHPALDVRVSPIAGRGLFANADLPEGTVVSRLGGRLVDSDTLAALFATHDASLDSTVDSIVVDTDRHLVLPPGNLNRFGNHSCAPNLGWADEYSLVTLAGVGSGTELTSDYATSTVDPGFVLRCHCQSYRCRQMVEGDDWRIPQLQSRYAGRWVPYIERLIAADPREKAGRAAGPTGG